VALDTNTKEKHGIKSRLSMHLYTLDWVALPSISSFHHCFLEICNNPVILCCIMCRIKLVIFVQWQICRTMKWEILIFLHKSYLKTLKYKTADFPGLVHAIQLKITGLNTIDDPISTLLMKWWDHASNIVDIYQIHV
jgi:hypothetical protein